MPCQGKKQTLEVSLHAPNSILKFPVWFVSCAPFLLQPEQSIYYDIKQNIVAKGGKYFGEGIRVEQPRRGRVAGGNHQDEH